MRAYIYDPFLKSKGKASTKLLIVCSRLKVCLYCHADNIEANVESTGVRVEAGNKQLVKAVTHKV